MNALIERLSKVRRTGEGRYIACCPAHDDKRPSMTIREMDDGRILFHCFSGCDPESILDAVGLTFADVMPESLGEHKKVNRPYSSMDLLTVIAGEAMVVSAIAANGNKERSRLIQATGRINAALEFARGL